MSESDIATALTLVISLRKKNATMLEQIRKSNELNDKAAAAKAAKAAAALAEAKEAEDPTVCQMKLLRTERERIDKARADQAAADQTAASRRAWGRGWGADQAAANQAKRGKALGKDGESKDDSNHPDDDDGDDTRGAGGSASLNVESQGSEEEGVDGTPRARPSHPSKKYRELSRADEEYGNIETLLRVTMAAEAERGARICDRN